MKRITAALALACLAGSTLSQQTIVVPNDIPNLELALNPAVSGLAPGDTIELRDTVSYAGTFTITTPGITIREAAGDDVVIDAFSTGSVFTVDAAGGTVTFEGLTLRDGSNPGSNGGAINVLASGGVVARDCDFNNNTANAGGAIYSVSPDLVLEDCTFTGNSSTLFGGAVRFAGVSGVSFTVSGCTFTANQAMGGNGGAIDHAGSGAVLTITDSTFSMNTCTITGGAVFATNPDAVRMERVDFIDNIALGTASQDTGGAFISNCTDVLIRDTSFIRNLC
ncbi:MAG: right-handed parallel beta-helix repeat-containing protein, partial [Planctomycetota bacterium]